MKGDRKKKYFRKGHPCFFRKTSGNPGTSEAACIDDEQPGPVLRKRTFSTVTPEGKESEDEYIIVHKIKLEDFMHSSFWQHMENYPQCVGKLKFDETNLEYFGMNIKASLKCATCGFVSTKHKLYKEVDSQSPGRKASTFNRSLSVGLLNSPIGPSSIRHIFASGNIKPASSRGMQKSLNKVSDIIASEGEMHLKQERQSLRNRTGGNVRIQCDAQYNNRLFARDNPFQAGTQCVFTVVEDETPQQKIIDVVTASKLCPVGERMKRRYPELTCPGHANCTATLDRATPIGLENRYAEQSAKRMKTEGLTVTSVTSDGDCKTVKGFQNIFHDRKIENPKCVRHFANVQQKAIKAANFSQLMFNGNKQCRTRKQSWFSGDLRARCTAEFNAAYDKCGPDEKKMNTLLANIPSAIIKCYEGDCSLCKKCSLVCNGPQGTMWKKHMMPKALKGKLEMTAEDRKTLHALITKRLGPNAVRVTYTNSSTQKVEALHRAYIKTNPKNVTSSKNFRARIYSAVMANNLGGDVATERLCNAVGHTLSEKVKKSLKKTEEIRQYNTRYKKKQEVKERRAFQKYKKFRQYENKCPQQEGYEKEVDLPVSSSAK